MSKSYKKIRDTRYEDNYNPRVYKTELRQHRKEKKLVNCLRSKDISHLIDDEDDL